MKKLFTFMIAALFASVQAMAQTAFATLVHGEALSSFTGADALKQAMKAAADGDIITLSAGTFDGCTITKAITLRGAGMEADELGRQTIIQTNNMGINIADGEEKSVSIEGISMPSKTLSVNCNLASVYLNKCVIETFKSKSAYNVMVEQAVITNCKMSVLSNEYHNTIYSNQKYSEIHLYNSYIVGIRIEKGGSRFDNCILGDISVGSYYNCIFTGNRSANHSATDHCVSTFALTDSNDSNNYQVEDITTLFNNYDANATWYTRDLTLTDEAKTKYLGSDGTEVGIYGGSLPFSPWLDRPFIKKLTVAPKSTRDGKLSVDIEVGDAE